MYGEIKQKRVKFKLDIGDTVRIAKHRMIFREAYKSGWSEERFKFCDCLIRHPPVNIFGGFESRTTERVFHEYELQKRREKDYLFMVNKILRRWKENCKLQ